MFGSSLFRRYVWLINTIYSAGHISHEQINNLWVTSSCNEERESRYDVRMLRRHRVAIAQIFGLFIELRRGQYFIANAQDVTENLMQKWALNSFAVQTMLIENKSLKSRILLEDIPSGHRYLSMIMEAMQRGKQLTMTYKGFTRGVSHPFLVAPYCLKVFRLRWYMVGQSEGNEDIRIYALDRINSLEFSDVSYRVPKKFDGQSYFAGYFGTVRFTGIKPQIVEIKTDSLTASYIRSLPLHSSQKELEQTPEYSIFSYKVAPTLDFVQELRMQGSTLQVLKPDWLVQQFKEELKKTLDLYTK